MPLERVEKLTASNMIGFTADPMKPQARELVLALAKEVCDILRSQASYFFTGLSGMEFAGWASLLKD